MSGNYKKTKRCARKSRRVQQELEDQLRDFGETMSDAFAHGFDGMGEEIGDAAWDVGRAAVDAANVGLNHAARAIRDELDESNVRDKMHRGQEKLHQKWKHFEEKYEKYGKKAQRTADSHEKTKAGASAGSFERTNIIFGDRSRLTPVEGIRGSAIKRKAAGIVMIIVSSFFGFVFGVSGIVTLASAASETGLGVVGGLLLAATAGFLYMLYAGWQRIKAARWLNRCADTVEGMDTAEGVSLGLLASDDAQKPRKILNRVRSYIQKGWLRAWLDEQAGKLYLTAQDYREAQKAKQQPPSEPGGTDAAQENNTAPHINLETVRRFAAVLEQEKALMRDEQAAKELEHMQKTALTICDWLEEHPESIPKIRRFAEYYIPTTLKLLHTYNDVQGQTGENAEVIRHDIAGILHTLNQAYDNLYNQLLSDTVLDISSEIAALEGMLANDGLTGGGLR